MLLYTWEHESEPGYVETMISRTPPKHDYDVQWVNNTYIDEVGDIHYEDFSDTFGHPPALTFEDLVLKIEELNYVVINGKEWCICFWISDVQLEFLIEVSPHIPGTPLYITESYEDTEILSAETYADMADIIYNLTLGA